MKKIIFTKQAPEPVGPYSQAIKLDSWLICSGQIPLDPITNSIVGKEVEEQSEQVFKNIQAVLSAGNLTFDDVVKTCVFLKNMSDFEKFNQVYTKYFAKNKPARSCVEVSRLPKDVLVEIEVWAYRSVD